MSDPVSSSPKSNNKNIIIGIIIVLVIVGIVVGVVFAMKKKTPAAETGAAVTGGTGAVTAGGTGVAATGGSGAVTAGGTGAAATGGTGAAAAPTVPPVAAAPTVPSVAAAGTGAAAAAAPTVPSVAAAGTGAAAAAAPTVPPVAAAPPVRPPFVSNGLVFHLDARDPLSYPGTGSTWKDLSSSGLNVTLYNAPKYSASNGGYLAFDAAAKQYGQTASALPQLRTWSIEVMLASNGKNVGPTPAIVTDVFNGRFLNFALYGEAAGMSTGFFKDQWYNTNPFSVKSASTIRAPGTPMFFTHFVSTFDGVTLKFWIDKYEKTRQKAELMALSGGVGVRIMRRWDDENYWDGCLSVVRIYNRALSSDEIEKNYNSSLMT